MSNQAGQYRAFLWLFTVVGASAIGLAFVEHEMMPPGMGIAASLAGIFAILIGGYFGWKGAQIRIAEREKKADAVALITLAAFLKDRSEEELTATAAKGGPAGEAAALILERRKNGLIRPSGTHTAG